MSRIQLLILLFGSMMRMALPGFGMIAKRAANVSSIWNVAPFLETEQEMPVLINGKMQATGMNKVLEASDTKKAVKNVEHANFEETGREKRSDMIFETAEVNAPDINEPESDTVTSGPRNVVLLLIRETAQDREDLWKDIKASHSFPVKGSLPSCYNNELDSERFSLNNALISGSNDKDCDCEHFLRSNVLNMISWARNIGKMATGSVSATNFSVQSPPGHDGPLGAAKEFEEHDQNSVKPEVGKNKMEMHAGWHPIDLGNPTSRGSSLMVATNGKDNGDNENLSDVFETFSRIRIALFRTLMEYLGGNMAASEEPIFSEKSYPSHSNIADVIGTAIKALKSVPNEKGYALVVTISGNQLASAAELLQREISRDTLLVITGACSHGAKPIPFFCQGPSASMLREAKTVWDIPNILRNVVAAGHRGSRIRRHHGPPFPGAAFKTNPRFINARKRLARDEGAVKQSNANGKYETTVESGKSETTRVESTTGGEIKSPSLSKIVDRSTKSETPNVKEITASSGEMSSPTVSTIVDRSSKGETANVEDVRASSEGISSSTVSEVVDGSAKRETTVVETTTASAEIKSSSLSQIVSRSAKDETTSEENATPSGEMRSSSASEIASGKLSTVLGTAMSAFAVAILSSA